MKYQNGWKPISRYETTKNEFSFIKPTGSFSAEAEAGAKLKLWKIDLLKAEADFNFGPEWEIWSYKYPNGNNKGGNNKLLQLVEEMRLQDDGQLMALIEIHVEKDRPHLRPDFVRTLQRRIQDAIGMSPVDYRLMLNRDF